MSILIFQYCENVTILLLCVGDFDPQEKRRSLFNLGERLIELAIWVQGGMENTMVFSHFCPGPGCEHKYHDDELVLFLGY